MSIKFLSTRWYEPLEEDNPECVRKCKLMSEWAELSSDKLDHAIELIFVAECGGELGYVLEWELDDGVTPTEAQVNYAKGLCPEGMKFLYVAPGGTSELFNQRAGYWYFSPGKVLPAVDFDTIVRGLD